MASSPLLTIDNLSIAFSSQEGSNTVVDKISFTIGKGECVAVVGESGSGKSVSALSILRLLPYPQASHPSGSITFDGKDVLSIPTKDLQSIRGKRISMIFQEPMTSLNPLHTIGKQLGEVIQLHQPNISKTNLKTKISSLLQEVGLDQLTHRFDAYPHQLSGGQRQRIMIAMALANDPDLLIADEPTTALDVTVQAKILDLLRELMKERDMSLLFISHDLSVVRSIAHKIVVMKDGKIVEENATEAIFKKPKHKYTKHLIDSIPSGEPVALPKRKDSVLSVKDLNVSFPIKRGAFGMTRGYVDAVKDMQFSIQKGETLGIVGESGSGKTTLAFALLRLVKAKGNVVFLGKSLLELEGQAKRHFRQDLQMVFQDPFASLSPRLTVGEIIAEGAILQGIPKTEAEQRVAEALKDVNLDPDMASRYPHEFSGGQRQRIAIARALILKPKCIILDEPTSALDVSSQSTILDLLKDMQKAHGIAYMVISHDLRIIRAIAHNIAVMKAGELVEYSGNKDLFNKPKSAYTKKLIKAAMMDA